jgi:hypothetical protein
MSGRFEVSNMKRQGSGAIIVVGALLAFSGCTAKPAPDGKENNGPLKS